MDWTLEPQVPDEVRRAVLPLIRGEAPAPDPWWQEGVDEAIATGPLELAPDQRDTIARPRSTPGAARA